MWRSIDARQFAPFQAKPWDVARLELHSHAPFQGCFPQRLRSSPPEDSQSLVDRKTQRSHVYKTNTNMCFQADRDDATRHVGKVGAGL